MPTLDAPARTAADDRPAVDVPAPTRPLAVSTCLTGFAVAGAGLLLAIALTVLGWLLDGASGTSGRAAGVGAVLWLTGHGATPTIGHVPVSLVPLGVPLVLALALVRGGRWAVATSAAPGPRGPAGAVAAGAATYAAVVAVVGGTVLAVPPGAAVDVPRAVLLSALVSAAALALGVGLGLDTWREVAARAPAELLALVRGALAGVVALLSCSAILLLVLLTVHADRLVALGAGLRPGVDGGLALAVLCVLSLPNAALWTTSYLLGPGFAVGAGTVVAPADVVLSRLPGFPLLGALPGPGDPPWWAAGLTVLPVLAGVLAGVVTARALPASGWLRTALTGAGGGAAAGSVLAALLLAAGGSAGPGRMAQTGPPATAGAVALLTLSVAACAGAVAHRALVDRVG